jgi:hypothetical protein
MAPTIGQFTLMHGWTITSWQTLGEGRLPTGGFAVGGDLLIGLDPQLPGACNLAWLDTQRSWCSMSLPFESGVLNGGQVPVSFGSLPPIVCESVEVTLNETGTTLKGTLIISGSDGNAGTFAAESNAGPPDTEPS